jgi:phage/plasmid-like protein (TIGR03299 family)
MMSAQRLGLEGAGLRLNIEGDDLMAHEVETMFSVRHVPWHGLGVVLEEAPDSEKALVQAGLLWGVEKRQLFLNNGQRVPDHFATVRMTDDRILGVVGRDYKVIQNREAFMWTDALLGEGAVYETAGSLREGRRVWLCAKLPEPIDLVGDQVDMYLLFTNSHDGSSSIRVAITPIRVVCQNTLTYGLKAAKRTWSIRHTSGAKERLNQAAMALKMTYRFGDAMRIDAEKLVAKRATLEEYLDRLIPLPRVDEKTTERMVANTKFVRDQLFEMAELWDLVPFKDTAWGALQTVTNFVSHGEPVRRTANFEENRFEALIDGHELLQRAHNLAVTI